MMLIDFLEFMISASNDSYIFLAGISAVIGAILPLSTIIFANFYEKSTVQTNDLYWELKREVNNSKAFIEGFNKIIYLGDNREIFNSTLKLFKLISYILILLWVLVGVGYIANVSKKPLDSFIISCSTLALISLLIYLPRILSRFQRELPIKVENKSCSINEIYNIFDVKGKGEDKLFYEEILVPTLSIVNTNSKLFIRYNQNLPLNNYKVFYSIQNKNKERLFINIGLLIKNKDFKNIHYTIGNEVSNTDTVQNKFSSIPFGIISKFNEIDSKNSFIYILDSLNQILYTGEVKCIFNSETKISKYTIKTYIDKSPNGHISKLLQNNEKEVHLLDDQQKLTPYYLLDYN